MREPKDWNEQDLQILIRDGVKEGINLDYKACDALDKSDRKKDEISKDVSAFANSAGGTIVYGIKESGNVPTEIDIGYDPNEISREWLEQIITSRIQRKIDGIIINQIELKESNPGRVVYIVQIPQSNRAPHMAHDNRFYKRYNFKSIPMEEYEVRDVQRRGDVPDLCITFALASNDIAYNFNSDADNRNELYSSSLYMRAEILNFSPKPVEYAIVYLFFDARIKIHDASSDAIHERIFFGGKFNVHLYKWSIPAKMPIWEGVTFSIADNIRFTLPYKNSKYIIGWEVKTPGVQSKPKIQNLCTDCLRVWIEDIDQ